MNKSHMKNQRQTPSVKATPVKPSGLCVLRRWLVTACCWFTVFCLALLLLNLVSESSRSIASERYLFLFPLALCLSGARLIRRSSWSKGTRYTIHPICTVGGIYLFGLLPYLTQSDARASLVMITLLLVMALYGMAVGIVAAILSKKRGKKEEATPYRSQFSRSDR